MSKTDTLEDSLKKVSRQTLDYSGADLRQKLLLNSPDALKKRGRAAVCVLFTGPDFLNSKILLTERSKNLATHAGQVAFPGGSFDEADLHDPVVTAFRECEEEVGIPRNLPLSLGQLPTFPTMTGNFEVYPVIAMLKPEAANSALSFQPTEVTTGEWVSVSALKATRQYEERTVSGITFSMPFFMWGERKMWGISAWIFDLILNRYDTIGE